MWESLAWPWGWYAVASVVTYLAYAIDKRRAVGGGGRRVRESTLHLLELVGGWPGAAVAQQVLRHKTRKLRYQVVYRAIVIGHILFWMWRLVWSR